MSAEVNVPLLRKAVEWAEAEAAKPDPLARQWDQSEYYRTPENRRAVAGRPQADCGTAYCIAGWVCHINGEQFRDTHSGMTGLLANGATVIGRAQELLGLDYVTGIHLFTGSNTIEDVRRIAEDIAGERL